MNLILSQTAIKDIQNKYDYYNIATKYGVEDITNQINILVHDGYITKADDDSYYRFNSPLLQQWWLINIVN
jgi:ribulose bisphosphate carboxylase small subunit